MLFTNGKSWPECPVVKYQALDRYQYDGVESIDDWLQ